MFLLKRIITVALVVIGSLASIILFAIINSLAHGNLTGGQVVLYGLITGVGLGILSGYLLINLIIRKARKFLFNKVGNAIQRFGFLRRI
ncbi:MAG: hypothetical protein M3040_15180 [Bacteroidota bacterium]|nr:hypothetical protein [Bacteroidota bacterium]